MLEPFGELESIVSDFMDAVLSIFGSEGGGGVFA
jgi:hypothetical protein